MISLVSTCAMSSPKLDTAETTSSFKTMVRFRSIDRPRRQSEIATATGLPNRAFLLDKVRNNSCDRICLLGFDNCPKQHENAVFGSVPQGRMMHHTVRDPCLGGRWPHHQFYVGILSQAALEFLTVFSRSFGPRKISLVCGCEKLMV